MKSPSLKLWVYFEQQKSVRVCFAQRLSMFNAFQNLTHQPEALFTSQGSQEVVKLLPHWGSFTFRPRYQYQAQQGQFIISISLQMFLKWSFAKWSQMNDGYQYQIDGNQWAAKLCLCSLCQFLLTNTVNQEKFDKLMLHRPPSHLAEKTVLLPCKLRKPELSLQGQRKSLPSSGSDHLVLEMISMSHEFDVQVVASWRLCALKVPCTSGFLGQ